MENMILNFLNANFEKYSTAELENILVTDFHVSMEEADALLVEYQNYDGSAPNIKQDISAAQKHAARRKKNYTAETRKVQTKSIAAAKNADVKDKAQVKAALNNRKTATKSKQKNLNDRAKEKAATKRMRVDNRKETEQAVMDAEEE